jgi:hypothetical protein
VVSVAEKKATQTVYTPSDEFKDLTPHQKLRSLEAIKQLKSGQIRRPRLCCGWCQSTSIEGIVETLPVRLPDGTFSTKDEELLHCLACSNYTRPRTAKTIQIQKIRRIILDGVDLPRRES